MGERAIIKIASPPAGKEGSGFLVRKVIGGTLIPTWDPFLMLDHLGPVEYKPGEAVGAPDHPHRGFAIVTYVVDGGVKHQDSIGNKGLLESGWVQWMNAGRGIVHSEMPPDDMMKHGGCSEGFQLWVNLPAKDKMIAPTYQDVPPENTPVVHENKAKIHVIAGSFRGTKSTINTKIPIFLLDVHLEPGGSLSIPVSDGLNGFVYAWRGAGSLGLDKQPVHAGQVGLMSEAGRDLYIRAEDTKELRALVAAGTPIKEPVAKHGPFVMNTWEEIEEAISDYREGRLGSIPGKEDRLRQTEAALAMQQKNESLLLMNPSYH
ncbi:uncharacterized protein LOC135498295 [Lineus longissimus]|uniref:uncharacterized protein LOC135498295 n=1 Tax=Lineus longissimus TaxID=88925 RepID=UPI002B4EA47C